MKDATEKSQILQQASVTLVSLKTWQEELEKFKMQYTLLFENAEKTYSEAIKVKKILANLLKDEKVVNRPYLAKLKRLHAQLMSIVIKPADDLADSPKWRDISAELNSLSEDVGEVILVIETLLANLKEKPSTLGEYKILQKIINEKSEKFQYEKRFKHLQESIPVWIVKNQQHNAYFIKHIEQVVRDYNIIPPVSAPNTIFVQAIPSIEKEKSMKIGIPLQVEIVAEETKKDFDCRDLDASFLKNLSDDGNKNRDKARLNKIEYIKSLKEWVHHTPPPPAEQKVLFANYLLTVPCHPLKKDLALYRFGYTNKTKSMATAQRFLAEGLSDEDKLSLCYNKQYLGFFARQESRKTYQELTPSEAGISVTR